MSQRIKKRFDIPVTQANTVHTKTFELDKTITRIHGILFTSDRDDLLYYRGTGKVEINGQEVFPDNYESKLLMTGLNVSPNDRFYTLGGIPTGNGKVKVDFRDNQSEAMAYANYRVSMYLDCEIS
jgi:hypothetical protein